MSTLLAEVNIQASDRNSREPLIDEALQKLIPLAKSKGRHGILVRRLDDRKLIVGLSHDVPYGYTEEQDHR